MHLQAVPPLLHAVTSGNAAAQHCALRTLFLLTGVSNTLLATLCAPPALAALASRAWHGKPDVQAVALLLLRDIARGHTHAFVEARTDALPLMVALEASPVADVAAIARDAVRSLEEVPAVRLERSVQVCSAFARLFVVVCAVLLS